MKIGIICASDDEFAPFLPVIENKKVTEKAMLKVYEGNIGSVEVAALYSGVCKVNASIAAQVLADCFGVTAVINSGAAGATDEKLRIFDTVISTECCYHDVAEDILTEFHPWLKSPFFESSPELLKSAKAVVKKEGSKNVFFGRTVTGESFISDGGRAEIVKKFAPLSVDMETAAIAHVCYANGLPFLSVRTITDTAAHDAGALFEENCVTASRTAADLTVKIIRELGCPPRHKNKER